MLPLKGKSSSVSANLRASKNSVIRPYGDFLQVKTPYFSNNVSFSRLEGVGIWHEALEFRTVLTWGLSGFFAAIFHLSTEYFN